jgi:thiol-disulfide isomerase/thioredoxin
LYRGKYLLVDFWASGCGPCRKENPNYVSAYRKYNGKGFEILAVSLDDDRKAWIKAINDDKLTWAHVSDLQSWQNSVALLYGVRAVPRNFLLDRSGKIIAKDLRGEDLGLFLEQLMNK